MKEKTRNYGMPKHKIIPYLYNKQGHTCPICKDSILQEVTLWVRWREQQVRNSKGDKVPKHERIRRKDVNLNIDHIIPVADGGSDRLSNLALTHSRCNDIKGSVNIYAKRPTRNT